MKQKRKNGIFYTPKDLAEFLVSPLVTTPNLSILDPAYGEGALLLAVERATETKDELRNFHLYGCDIKPVNGLLKHLPEANLKKKDFFEYSKEIKHDLILTNPPYVRHHIQNNKKIANYRLSHPELEILSNTSDLWAFFVIKSVSHLRPGGSMGAILPWAFLQADYACPLRKWLYDKFETIQLLALSNKYFEDAQERVVLVWLKNYGLSCKSLLVGSAKDIEQTAIYSQISYENWISNRVFTNDSLNLESVLRKCKDYGFSEFENFADVKIGVVTGAVDHFVIPSAQAKSYGFKKKHLIPILTDSKDILEYQKNGTRKLKKLVKLGKGEYQKFRKFIRKGVEAGYNLRRHSVLRSPWYSVKIGQIPDAFFHYRVSKFPYLVSNPKKIQSTNSIHRVYFKKMSSTERKWLTVSLLSVIGQLSIEANSKTYGRGFLKTEPSSLNKALSIARKDRSVDAVYNQVLKLLKQNSKEEAVEAATAFINKKLDISIEIALAAELLLKKLQEIRLSN